MIGFEPLLHHVPAWLLVFFRIAGIFFFAPALGSATIPPRIKIIFAGALSFCVYPMLLMPGTPAWGHVEPIVAHGLALWVIPAAVATELLIGLIVGYGASLPLIGLQVGGQICDQQMGIGFAGIFNPDIGAQQGVVGEFLFLLGVVLFLVLGGHHALLGTMVGSFAHVPLGGFGVDGDVVRMILGLLTAAFELGIRVAAPLLLLIFLETLAMGFLARTVPQMNILSIGFPVRIIAGVVIIVSSLSVMMGIYIDEMHRTMRLLLSFFTGH